MSDRGEQRLMCETESGKIRRLKMNVTDVHKTLVAMSAVADAGHTIIISNKHGCSIINDETGERTPVHRQNGVCIMKLKVLAPVTSNSGGRALQLAPMDAAPAAGSAGPSRHAWTAGPGGNLERRPFIRQARP